MTEDVKKCIEQAERFLVLREHNKNELADKLKTKNYSQDVIEQAIAFLIDCDELNEERYINTFIRSSNRKHPEGKIALQNRLYAKKADRELSKKILDAVYTPEYVQQLIEEGVKKLEKKHKTGDLYREKQELLKLGFSSSDIRNYLEKQ